ncbi:type II toxin-antitoxin system RelE/ParE family toxin [Desulfovibrio sp. OttesenSCG-928-G11]|nr:type II toxin-antitoxin system RelE/ParE family toxin [Desulfovibrio sp. OttesenSCG-928-G11]
MEFIETVKFAACLYEYLDDDSYLDLQLLLIAQPDRGDLIKGGGGIRKLRFAMHGKGKSGGIRIIYYWVSEQGQIYLLHLYPKSKKENLTDAEVAELRQLAKEINHG